MESKTLTYRQWEALQAVVDAPNASHADRARTIGIAEHTFRSHLRHAYRALGVHSLTAALVTVMDAPPDRAGPLMAALGADPRFRVLATATSAQDVRYKLALHPDALLIQAQVFPDFDALAAAISGYDGAAFILLPADTPPSVTAAVSELPPVQQVISGEVNLPELAGRIYETLTAQQRLRGLSSPGGLLQQHGPRAAMVGWRCIAVWSLQGGVGKSTLSASLALEAAERRLPTLLTGLGTPDVLPLRLGFDRPAPNLLDWVADPTPEGLRLAVRQYDVLDVLAGFPDQAALDRYLPDAMSSATGLPALANTAAHAGYAVVVLDVSSPELAAPAIAAANTLLIVAPATPDGLLAAREATRLAHQALAGRHAAPRPTPGWRAAGAASATRWRPRSPPSPPASPAPSWFPPRPWPRWRRASPGWSRTAPCANG